MVPLIAVVVIEVISRNAFGIMASYGWDDTARALGLDCGAMSGFNNAKVDEEFFAGTAVKSNFLCNIGYGNTDKILQRSPRFKFDEVCQII